MKKLFNLLMIALCVFATACSDDDDDPKPIPFTADPTALTFAAEGGSQKVTLSLEGALASADKEWCTVVVNKAEATVTVAASEETEIRTAKVTFTLGKDQTVNVTVTQNGKATPTEELTPEKTEVEFTAEGGEEVVNVKATTTFTAASSESWLTATAAEGKVTLKAAANTAEARTAKVTLTMGEKIAEITVHQAAPFKVSYDSYIGTWKLKGTTSDGKAEFNIVITPKVQGKSYNVAGWCGNAVVEAYPFTMYYENDGSILIKGHQELATLGEGNTRSVVVVAGVVSLGGGKYSLIKSGEIEEAGKTEGYDAFTGKYDGNELKMIGQDVKLSNGTTYTFGAIKYYLYQFDPDPEKVGFYSLKEDDAYAWDPVMTKVSNNTSSVNSVSDAFPSVEKFANSLSSFVSVE